MKTMTPVSVTNARQQVLRQPKDSRHLLRHAFDKTLAMEKVLALIALSSVCIAMPTRDGKTDGDQKQICYSCSSKSALCKEEVYDGKYLSMTSCNSTCYLRQEANMTYRGCFDGWLGGQVDSSYVGCRIQQYLGERVEWCFCRHNVENSVTNEPCNSVSVKHMRKVSALKTGKQGVSMKNFLNDDTNSLPVYEEYSSPDNSMSNFAKEQTYNDQAAVEPIGNKDQAVPFSQSVHPVMRPLPSNPCKDRSDGTYATDDCSQYIQCFSGLTYEMTCAKGTQWDDGYKRCVHPDKDRRCAKEDHEGDGFFIDDWEGINWI